ncbi:MAG: FAD-dependent oxidoreductase [Lachnospiraceae bacterium]|nr:FAD-dependent oxidoreductase [Lachnospiraceae bacterium]
MAFITIDGVRLDVPEGKNVLECALDAGLYIPHLCHHKDLPENGACRLCIVELEGEDHPVPSCTLRAEEGMVITTHSDRLKHLRELAMELLLAGHPEDCSTCPKYGNCELQTLIQYIGASNTRMKHRSKGFRTIEENPLITHDMNRCVLCGRCVRACNDLRGVKVLDYRKKDLEIYVGTLHEKLLTDADCRFCTACAEVCPTGSIRLKDRAVVKDMSKEDQTVPCRGACPAHTDVPRYIRFVKEGNFDAAAAVIREKVPFPAVLGYICNHVCELSCKRRDVNEALSIRNIKRYAAEHDTGKYWKNRGKQLPDTGKKVCVVGAGPSGLTAAYFLRKQGHDVVVKEALPDAGGMMRFGIPAYRLPREVLQEEVDIITEAGVKLEFNSRVSDPKALLNDFDAVLMAVGAHVGTRLPIEGAELPGVLLNIDFLRKASLGEETGLGKKVIVLGGGNVAFDCARTAKRLGAEEIHLACLEARENMTADDEEIEQAKEEGIFVHPAQSFERITGTDKVTGVDFMNVLGFHFDENRRAITEKEEGSEHHIDADTVIFAVGQRPDMNESSGLELFRGSYIVCQPGKKATSTAGIFASGDCVYGTKSVIEAIEDGRKAASEIDLYLGGDGDITEKFAPEQIHEANIGRIEGFGKLERKAPAIDSAESRSGNFGLFDHGIPDCLICGEAERCLQCDLALDISKPRRWSDVSRESEVMV